VNNDDDPASAVYAAQVAGLISASPRASSYQPASPVELFVKDRRAPRSLAELAPIEQLQLERMFRGQDLARLLERNALGDEELEGDDPLDVEVALVVDGQGTPRYRLYGMNYGCVYLMEAERLECLAFAAQHDLEHWGAGQRELFWAMDRAMQRGDHGFRQPMKWCWWDDTCWDDLADAEPGTVQSEPSIRRCFAGEN
jgi:hypothetical protein